MGRSIRRNRRIIAIAVAIGVLLIGGWAWHSAFGLPKRFGIVEVGRMYRSGEISPRQLERVAREHGIRTVLSMLDPADAESVAEREAAERLGLRWLNVPLRGDGSSTAADRDRIRALILDPSNEPMLVHCAVGANRTGLACGMYRLHVQGWTVERVLNEMRDYGFDDLPKHENLRAALRAEAEIAASRPALP